MLRRLFESVTIEFLMRSSSYRAALRQFPSAKHYDVPQAPSASQEAERQEYGQTEDLCHLQMALEPERVAVAA
jgi:hypothetical protein